MEDKPQTEQPEQSDQTDSQPANDPPQWRSSVQQGIKKRPASLYAVGESVLVKKGRGTEGPYRVDRVNVNGTYDLRDASGNIKSGVRENQIDPP